MKTYVILFLICACHLFGLRADLNGDCRVDMEDLAILMSEWMQVEDCNDMALGRERITNGTFDADLSDWTAFTFPEDGHWEWYNSEQAALLDYSDADMQAILSQTLESSIASGKTVRASFSIFQYEDHSYPNGLVKLQLLNASNDEVGLIDATDGDFGIYSDDITLTDTVTSIRLLSTWFGDYAAYFDNISVREILPDSNMTSIHDEIWGMGW
jgi:hypothetical protein